MAAEAPLGMDWDGVLEADLGEIDKNEALAEALYGFLIQSEVGDSALAEDAEKTGKILRVMRAVLKVKGEEADVAFDELQRVQGAGGGGASERDLLDQIIQLEKENREKEAELGELRERVSVAPGNEARYLREEIEDLQRERDELRRRLDHERGEGERLASEKASEQLRARQLERENDRLKQNLEDYRKQLEWQQEREGVQRGGGEGEFRERLRRKDLEIAEQLDKIEELLNARDSLEQQLHQLTVQLGLVEEQRLLAMKDTEKMRTALAEADGRSDELETRNKLLEGQVGDLHERLQEQAGADDQIMAMVTSKAQEWEAVLSSKETEVVECRQRISRLEDQLRAALVDTNRAAMVQLKKQLQERDDQLAELQHQLSEAAQSTEALSSQLEQARRRGDPYLVNPTLQAEVERLREHMGRAEEELAEEVRRREEAEAEKEEREVELTQALGRLGEYERGEYGLHEAVQEIKMRKDEIAVRDRDIAELTRRMNELEGHLNQLSEENEAMRAQLGLGEGEEVDVSGVRWRRNAELEELRNMNRMMEREVERLEEEKLKLRKQVLQQAMNRGQRVSDNSTGPVEEVDVGSEVDTALHSPPEAGKRTRELAAQVSVLQKACDSERRRKELSQQELSKLRDQLKEAREQLNQFEAVVKELSASGGKRERGHGKGDAVERLVAMLEARSADGKYDITLQLKSEVSQLSGQNDELRSQLRKVEEEVRDTLKQLERKQLEVENLRKALTKASAGFQPLPLPEGLPMTSNDIISSLNEHLLHTLRELHSKEKAQGELQEALEKHQRKFAVIIHQQGIVYQEYHEARRQWESEREQLMMERNELAALREQDQIRLQELKDLQEMLSHDGDAQRQRLGELSRKVTILRVNEKALSRRYTLLRESEATLRKERNKLRQEMVAMEKAITERMGYLQRYKEAVQFKLSSLQQQLTESVPASLLEKANKEHSELVIRYQETLHKQTSFAAASHTVDRLRAEVKTLSDQLESVKHELTLEKQKCHRLEQNTQASTGKQQQQDVHHDTSAFAERLATIEMKELNERQRADLAVMRGRQAHEVISQLEQRNTELEDKFSEMSQRLLQAQAREAELGDKLASCISELEKESLETQIQVLKKSEAHLRLENSQLKEVAEVARQQTVAMETWQKSRDLELSSLRHQLLDLQMQSDEKTVIGKLHHQIVALQVSEATALKRTEDANAKVLRLEASLLRCEQQRDELSDTIFHIRAQSQTKIRHLRTTIQSLRRQCAGALPLSQQEKHAELIHQLEHEKVEAERVREAARRDQEQAQDKLAQLELQHSNLQELMAALRDPKNTAAKLTEWHAKLGDTRLRELGLNRSIDKLREQVKHLEKLVADSEKAFTKLEGDLVQVTKDYESSQFSWEQREVELEQQLQEMRQQQTKMASAAAKVEEASGNIPDPQLPVAAQLEQALKTLRQNAHTITEVRQQTKMADEHADRLEKALNKAQNQLLKRDRELAELHLQMSALGKEQVGSHNEPDSAESQRALRTAQETAEQLRLLMAQKESQAEKYQRLLQEARAELQTVAERHKDEVASLLQQLHNQNDSAFSKLKQAALEAVNIPPPELPTDKQLARLQELEDLVVEQEAVNADLARKIELTRRELSQAEQASRTQEAELREEMEEMRKIHQKEVEALQRVVGEGGVRVTELEQEVEILEGELSAAQEAARQAPSRTMRSLVERLRNQLAIKEKQHKSLSQALLQVRSELVEATQRTLDGQTRQQLEEVNIQQLVERRTSELQSRIQDLSSRLDKLKLRLEESQSGESEAKEKVHQLERELSEKNASVHRLESELRQQRRTLEQARSREQRLAHEVRELHHHSEHSPEVEELQKRVKVLQGKLEREKQRQQQQQLREHEGAQRVQRQPEGEARRQAGGGGTTEASAQIDSKHSSVEVLKWEESKRWQKRVDSLRAKLSEKNRELEAAMKQASALKEMLARADREKGVLQGKLKSTQKAINEAPQSQHGSATTSKEEVHAEECHTLRSRIFELENEVQRLQREGRMERVAELQDLQMRNGQLMQTVETLEEQLQQQRPGAADELYSLRDQERKLQEELLQSQKENMQLRFEFEQAVVELPRLKARVVDLQQYTETMRRASQAEGNTRASGKKDGGGGGHSVAELERVVAAMRKVVERLQNENETLKKAAAQHRNGTVASTSTKVVELESENKRLKAEVERLHTTTPSAWGEQAHLSSSKSPYSKIAAENDRLRKDLKKEREKMEQLQLSLSSLEIQNSRLHEDLKQYSSSSRLAPPGLRGYEERVEVLEAEVEKKTKMLQEVKRHLREAAEREQQLKTASPQPELSEQYLTVLRERDALQQQVAQLKKELDAFDPAFFEEVEDLKYNYQEAVRKNIQYEEQLTQFSKQFGIAVPSFES